MVIIPEIMKVAEDTAHESPCTRRQYGVVIADGATVWTTATNERVGRCCDGNICIRDRDNLQHVEAIERGAEIHAETMALLKWDYNLWMSHKFQFYLAGFRKGTQLKGANCRPCHYCCMQMIRMGFDNYIVKDENDELVFVSTWETMEAHESTYGSQLV